jgi:hypothetical protein
LFCYCAVGTLWYRIENEAERRITVAEIVLGFASSHGPTIQSPPERWPQLGEKDTEDPRFSYEALLAVAKPGMDQEVTAEKMRERAAAVKRGVEQSREVLAEAAADVYVVMSNPHGVPPLNRMAPVFGIYLSNQESKIERTGYQSGGRRGDRAMDATEGRSVGDYPISPELADHLMANLVDNGFDVAAAYQSSPDAGLEGPFTYHYDVFLPNRAAATVPFVISRYLPNQATPARCYEFGKAVRRAVESWEADARVCLVASGGLSHQVLDEEFDREVIRALETNDSEILCSLPRDRLNRAPGTSEILNWVALAGAMDGEPMTLIDYVPCYRSLAGTGHGVTFGYWK